MNNLLSIGRKQKLDLLAHLVTNLPDTLILRGDSGSGKSSLLQAAMQKNINNNDALLLNAELSLSFESIQYELLQFLNKKYQLDSRSIADVLLEYKKQGKKLVLIVDDAGLLLTGLINALVNYAKEYSALKLVFALTPDELLIKSQTDGLNNGCHYIDLLSLNYAQTSELVQQMVAAGGTRYIERDVNGRFLQEVYKETRGNLSAIKSLLKKAKTGYFNKPSVLITVVALIALASTMSSIFFWRYTEEHAELVLVEPLINVHSKKIVVKSNAEKINTAKNFKVEKKLEKSPVIIPPVVPTIKIPNVKGVPQLDIPVVKLRVKANGELKKELAVQQEIKGLTKKIDIEGVVKRKKALPVPVKKVAMPANEETAVINDFDDRVWILGQEETAYTMQLMALSSKAALLQEQQKFKKMGYKTYFLVTELNKKQVYTLYYGIFKSVEDANNKIVELPGAMQKAWLRKIMSIKQKLN